MADVEIPAPLLELRRAFLAAQERLRVAGQRLPSHSALEAGEAEPASEGQLREWREAQEECRRLAKAILESPAWEMVEDRKAVRRALDNVTQVGGDTPEGAA